MRVRMKTVLLSVFLGMVLLNGCATRPHDQRFYVLNTLDNAQKAGTAACAGADIISLGIGSLDVPKYLDRPQIMTRINQNELKLSDSHQWAEPLKDTIPRIIGYNVGSLVCGDIRTYPWKGTQQIDYRLNASIIHLDGTPGGNAVLDVQWNISDEHTKKILLVKESKYTEQVEQNTYESLVSAYSRLLASFSRDMAEALISIQKGK